MQSKYFQALINTQHMITYFISGSDTCWSLFSFSRAQNNHLIMLIITIF